MHILIFPPWYFPAGTHEIGGRNFQLLAKALREENIDARILYAQFSHFGPWVKKNTYQIEDDVPTWRVYHWFPGKVHLLLVHRWIEKYVNEILQYIEKEGKPDLIHAQSYLPCMVAHQLKLKLNIPFIYTEHLSSFIEGNIPGRYKELISESSATADLITCVSPGLKSRLLAYTSGNIEVVPNFYDPKIFHDDPSIDKNKIFTWVCIGEPSFTKGLDILIQAFGKVKQRLPDSAMQLILIDEIKDKQKLIKLAGRHKVEKIIKWTGLISHESIADILRRCHALISASRVETFGTVMVEAQACGLPVIATRTAGASYIITSAEQGMLVDINNIDSLANAMSEMYLNYSTYDPGANIASVESRFKKEMVIRQWIKLYTEIIS